MARVAITGGTGFVGRHLAALAQIAEWTMKVPLVAKAQVRMLAEGVVEAAPAADDVPPDLAPRWMFTVEQIRAGLPEPAGFRWSDLRAAR